MFSAGSGCRSFLPVLIFAPVGLIQSIGTTVGSIYLAKKGKPGLLFKWGLFAGSIFIMSFVIGLQWGIAGVAACYAIASFALTYPSMAIAVRLIGLTVRDCLSVLWRPLLCSIVMALVLVPIDKALSTVWIGWKSLAVDGLVGFLAYAGMSLMFNSAQLGEFARIVHRSKMGT